MPEIIDVFGSAYLSIFGAGVVLGATSAYFALKFRKKDTKQVWEEEEDDTEEIIEDDDDNNASDEYRLVLGIRHDLKMQKGKVAAQCGHASVAAYAKALDLKPRALKKWLRYGGTKITVRIESESEMLELDKKARGLRVLSSIIRDAGQTQVAPGTRTVIAFGPARRSVLNQITGHLKLY